MPKIKICKECAYYSCICDHVFCNYYYKEEEYVDLVHGTKATHILARSNSPSDMRDGSSFKRFWKNCGRKGKFWKSKMDLIKPTQDDVE